MELTFTAKHNLNCLHLNDDAECHTEIFKWPSFTFLDGPFSHVYKKKNLKEH